MSAPAFDLLSTEPPLRYGAMHAQACRLALRQGAARWGVYVGVAALLAGAGADLASAVAALQAMAAWLVLPVFWLAAKGPAWALAGTLGHAGVGAGLLLGARQWLWPSDWAEQERALPLALGEQIRSDLHLIAWALLPWGALCLGGAAVWLLRRPAWLMSHGTLAVVALVLALLGSAALGVWMQWLRRRPAGLPASTVFVAAGPARSAAAAAAAGPASALARQRSRQAWPWVLLLQPLWRGVAPRTFKLLLVGSAGVLVLAAAATALPRWAPWWLAGQTLACLVVVSRLNLLTLVELQPLQVACAALPLQPAGLAAGRRVLVALPLALGLAATALGVWWAVPAEQLRAGRLTAWVACTAAACAMELHWTHRNASDQAVRWLFMLVLSVSVGSEVWT